MDNERQDEDNQDGDLQEYLTKMLQLNPLYEGDRIVSLRAERLGHRLSESASPDLEELDQRSAQLQKLQAIRNEFWKDSVESIRARLNELNVEKFHELRAPVARLNLVAEHRDRLAGFPTSKRFDEDFLHHLKWILIASPHETAKLREQLLVAFHNPKNRKQGRPLIRQLKANYPEIYSLEAAWLSALTQEKAREVKTAQKTNPKSGSCLFWFILIVFGLRILRNLFSD